jgi:hypothetical protein
MSRLALRDVLRTTNIVSKRSIAQLQPENNFLPKLLSQNGFRFTEGKGQPLTIHFKIDRNAVCLNASYNLAGSEVTVDYPPYNEDATLPELPANFKQLNDMAKTAWKEFCKNDFLELTIDAELLSDGLSLKKCSAQVDESAVHRQSEIFKHVVRTEHGVEVEAEKSLLVFRE